MNAVPVPCKTPIIMYSSRRDGFSFKEIPAPIRPTEHNKVPKDTRLLMNDIIVHIGLFFPFLATLYISFSTTNIQLFETLFLINPSLTDR